MRHADRAALAIGALTILLCLPAIGVGLTADDYWWVLALDSAPGFGPFDMSFTTAREAWTQRGAGFWWASDGFHWTLMRPLSVELFRLFWALFGASRVAWQAVNIAGYLTLLTAVWPLYRRLLGGRLAVAAFFVFATQFSHLQLLWFASNAHSWLAAIPVLLALDAWIRWREEAWRPGLWLAPLGFALGLCASETALGGLAFWLAYEGLARRWRAVLAGLAAAALYVGLHGALDYGTRGSVLYLDPRESPGAYLVGLLERTPVMVAGAIGVAPADLWIVSARARPALTVAGLVGAGVLAALVRGVWASLEEGARRALRLLVLGALFSLPLVASAPPGGRLLLWATFGAAAPVATVLVYGGRWRAWMMALAVGLSAVGMPLQLRAMGRLTADLREAARTAEIDDSQVATQRLVVLTMPDALTAQQLLPARLVEHKGVVPAGWTVLSAAAADHRVQRPGANTLVLTVQGGAMWEQAFEQLFLPPDAGDYFVSSGVEARVLERRGERPTTVAFTFDPPIDDPGWSFLAWQDGALRAVVLPEVGGEVEIRWSGSPFPRAR